MNIINACIIINFNIAKKYELFFDHVLNKIFNSKIIYPKNKLKSNKRGLKRDKNLSFYEKTL